MSISAIRCQGIGKRYRIGPRQRYRALRDTLADVLRAPFHQLRRALRSQPAGEVRSPEFLWALKGINLEVQQGEVLGIIGRNGAIRPHLDWITQQIDPSLGQAAVSKGQA